MFLSAGSRARARARAYDSTGYQIGATVSGNNLYITLGPAQGSPALPFIEFRDPAITSGNPYYRPVQAGSQLIIASGSTMASVSNIPLRLWVVGFDNGGGVSLAAINCVTGGSAATQIFSLDESTPTSTTAGTGGSTAATFYSAQALSSRPFRILGYLEWSSGLATAGTWNVKPTKIQLFGPGIKKPNDPVKMVMAYITTVTTNTSSTYTATTCTASISPTSAVNAVVVAACGNAFFTNVQNITASAMIGRNSNANRVGSSIVAYNNNTGVVILSYNQRGVDFPGTTSSTTYTIYTRNDNNSASVFFPRDQSSDGGVIATMELTEIMV